MTTVCAPRVPADESVEQAVARLLAEEYGTLAGPQVVMGVVQTARRELAGSPVGALPELVERLARYRLNASVS
ncbi:three-helix bundle dimerization domain-containing protein [Modestobacter sp. URMC 112]